MMVQRFFFALAAVASVAMAASGSPIGGVAGVAQDGLQTLVNSLMPTIEDEIKNIKIKDIKKHESGFDVHLYDMRVEDFKCDDPCIEPEFEGDGEIKIKLPGFKLKFHIRASASKGFIHVATKCDAKIGTAKVKAEATLDASGGKLSLSSVDADADVGSIDPNCGGGISGDIINIISGIFKDKIKHTLDDTIQDQIKSVIKDQGNKLLKDISWKYELEPGLVELDFSPQSVNSEAGKHLSLGLLSQMNNEKQPASPPAPLPSLPTWSSDASSGYLQVMLSAWSLDSVAFTYWKLGRLQKTITHDDIGPNFFPLNTSFMSTFAPGLKSAYPDGAWMEIVSSVSGAPLANISKSGVVAQAPVTFQFNVVVGGDKHNPKVAPAFTVTSDCVVGLNFSISSTQDHKQVLHASIIEAKLPLNVSSTQVGPVHVGLLSNVTNTIMNNVIIPLLDGFLKTGIPLPSSPDITLKKTHLQPDDGYLLIATEFDVHPNDHSAPRVAANSNVQSVKLV